MLLAADGEVNRFHVSFIPVKFGCLFSEGDSLKNRIGDSRRLTKGVPRLLIPPQDGHKLAGRDVDKTLGGDVGTCLNLPVGNLRLTFGADCLVTA
jgi:hypothetical protein